MEAMRVGVHACSAVRYERVSGLLPELVKSIGRSTRSQLDERRTLSQAEHGMERVYDGSDGRTTSSVDGNALWLRILNKLPKTAIPT